MNPVVGNGANPPSPDPNNQIQLDRATAHLRRMRSFRQPQDARFAGFYRQYVSQRDQQYFPDGITKRANNFFPYPYSNVKAIVSRVSDAFFSFDPWFDTAGLTPVDDPNAEPMQTVLEQKLRKAKVVAAFEDLVKTIGIYGTGGIMVDWDWGYDRVTYLQPDYFMVPVIDPQTGQAVPGPDGQPQKHPLINPMDGQPVQIGQHLAIKNVPRARPKFTAIDIYDLLIDPDGGIAARLTEKTWAQMQMEQETSSLAAQQDPTKKPLYYPEAMQTIAQRLTGVDDANNVIIRIAELWNELDGTCMTLTFSDDWEVLSWKDQRYASRSGSGYSAYKRNVMGGSPILLWAGDNPFNHKRIPILWTNYTKLPNEVYGVGAIEEVSDLVEGLNRSVNMITDNWNLGINRRYAYNTEFDIDHNALNNANVPGGKVAVGGDVNQALKELPTHTPSQGDYAILELFRGMIENGSGVSDFYAKGVGSPTNNKTATGISSVINESNYGFKMFIRNLELDILQPLLEMCASNCQQFLTDQDELFITKAQQPGIPKANQLSPEQIVGGFEFSLVAANYASNKLMKQRNIMALINTVGQTPLAQYIKPGEFLSELAKLMEVRDAFKFLKTDEEVQQEQQIAQQQQIQMMVFEANLQAREKIAVANGSPPKAGERRQGRPATRNLTGSIPGANSQSPVRDIAQAMGSNMPGMEGAGQVPGAE